MHVQGFDAYRLYLGVKLHFTREDYDVKASNGKGYKVSQQAYEKRNDKRLFEALGRNFPGPQALIHCYVAGHLVSRPWVGALLDQDLAIYRAYKTRRERMTYNLQKDLALILEQKFSPDLQGLVDNIRKITLAKRITPETASILDQCFSWTRLTESDDTLLWPKVKFLVQKYSSFVPGKDKYIATTAQTIREHSPALLERIRNGNVDTKQKEKEHECHLQT